MHLWDAEIANKQWAELLDSNIAMAGMVAMKAKKKQNDRKEKSRTLIKTLSTRIK